MLYDSTKSLLQTILRALEATDENRWDDQTESGNACLYEMHQMSGSLYKAYKPDKLNGTSQAQGNLPERLARAIPHVRNMVIAIRHKEQTPALESGKAALAELNGTRFSVISVGGTEPMPEASVVPRPAVKHRLLVKRPTGTLASAGI